MELTDCYIGFIGCGSMGGTLAAVAAKAVGGEKILTADHHPEKLEKLRADWGTVPSDAAEIGAKCRYIFLGVKPQGMEGAAAELREALATRVPGSCTVITMAAGLTAAYVSSLLGDCPVLRIMPNTPAAAGEGVILYAPGPGSTPEDEAALLTLLSPAGQPVKLPEEKLDAASALSGCGPAFVCLFAEALTDGAVRCGIPRAQALALALQTLRGTAALAQATGTDPALLRGAVCSPAGSTIEGVAVLDRAGVRGAVMDAVTAAYRRTLELKG